MLHFQDKGNKSREIPVSHDLKVYLDEYLNASSIHIEPQSRSPDAGGLLPRFIFRTAVRNEKRLTSTGMNAKDICRMVKRRLRRARLPRNLSFDLDVCATAESAKCRKFFALCDDGLKQHWEGICWMNPPYGREIGQWMQKAFESAQEGATVVCLVPARTDTKWRHRYAMRGEIRDLRARLKFGHSVNSAPFPSAVVIFRPPRSGQSPTVA